MDDNAARARELAPLLVGQTIKQARRRVTEEPGVFLREIGPSDGVVQVNVFGRITVTVERGVVIAAEPG